MRLIIPVVLLMAIPLAASAQSDMPEPHPGDRVYTTDGGRRIEGTLVALDDSVVIRTADGESVVRPRPAEIFRHTGHVSAGDGFLTGARVGAVAGLVVGVMSGYAEGDDEGTLLAFTAEDKAVLFGVTLGGVGALLGGIIGAATSGDRWERVPLRPRVGIGIAAPDAVVVGFELRH